MNQHRLRIINVGEEVLNNTSNQYYYLYNTIIYLS